MTNEKDIAMPITVAREEFVRKIVATINESNLPYFVIESILKDFLNEIHAASIKQLEADRRKYNSELQSKLSDE